MTDKPGPWDLPDAPPSPPAATPAAPRDRLWLWLGALAAVGVLIAALAHAYPEALRSGDDKVELVYRLMLVLLVSGGLLRAARRPWSWLDAAAPRVQQGLTNASRTMEDTLYPPRDKAARRLWDTMNKFKKGGGRKSGRELLLPEGLLLLFELLVG